MAGLRFITAGKDQNIVKPAERHTKVYPLAPNHGRDEEVITLRIKPPILSSLPKSLLPISNPSQSAIRA